MLIGVTGKTGVGKDFLCTLLKKRGYTEISLDTIGHLALQHKEALVAEAFPQITNAQKIIDRKKLGDLVFCNQAALHKLEQLLHPYMKELVLQELNASIGASHIVSGERTMDSSEYYCKFILNAAILEKLGLLPLCDLVLWIYAPLWLRAWRIWNREKIGLISFLRRNRAQWDLRPPASGTTKIYYISNNIMCKKIAALRLMRKLEQIPQLALQRDR